MFEVKPRLLYVLSNGNLYGTERMALATVSALRDDFSPVIVAPPGPLGSEARDMNIEILEIDTSHFATLAVAIVRFLSKSETIVFIATRPFQAYVFFLLNLLFRRHAAMIFVVHTRAGLYHRRLKWIPIPIVAISHFVKEGLLAYGVSERQVVVIENFLTITRVAESPVRNAFVTQGIRNVGIISRLEPSKRIDLLLSCLEAEPGLNALNFIIYGSGSEQNLLQQRASTGGLRLTFKGFRTDIARELASLDLLLHLCPDEPFGLVVLEAMAARVPVLAPDKGGAGSVIANGITGFHFRANDRASLGAMLARLTEAEPALLNSIVTKAHSQLFTRFSEAERLRDYRDLILQQLTHRTVSAAAHFVSKLH